MSGCHLSGTGTCIRMAHWEGTYMDPLAGGCNVLGFYVTWGSCISQRSDSFWQLVACYHVNVLKAHMFHNCCVQIPSHALPIQYNIVTLSVSGVMRV